MSSVSFTSPTTKVTIRGAERAWLGHLAKGIADQAWDLHGGFDGYGRGCILMDLAINPPDYLVDLHTKAVAEHEHNQKVYAAWKPGTLLGGEHDHQPRFLQALRTFLAVDGLNLAVAGTKLHTFDLGLNTALAMGSDPVRLAAKMHGWCEIHAWVDGPDRVWLAGVIREGLNSRIYRADMGWEELIEELCDNPDEPMVTSYSVTESWMEAGVVGYLGAWPEGVEKRWDSLTPEQQQARETRQDEWHELPADRQWEIGMQYLATKPWLQLTPESLGGQWFSKPLTVFDVLADNREERIALVLDVEEVSP